MEVNYRCVSTYFGHIVCFSCVMWGDVRPFQCCCRGSPAVVVQCPRRSGPSTPGQWGDCFCQDDQKTRSEKSTTHRFTIQVQLWIKLHKVNMSLLSYLKTKNKRMREKFNKQKQKKLTVTDSPALSLNESPNMYMMGFLSLTCICNSQSVRYWSCRREVVWEKANETKRHSLNVL